MEKDFKCGPACKTHGDLIYCARIKHWNLSVLSLVVCLVSDSVGIERKINSVGIEV